MNDRMERLKSIMAAAAGVSLSICMQPQLYADEGMWLPSLISERLGDMQEKGLRLDAEDIYSINSASLKDAVVLFGRGCTGEVISPDGLLLTNHHCGYAQIQRHSDVEHDYLRDGFWAMSRDEELPNEGLTVSFLERMDDVTARVLEGFSDGMSEHQRDSVVKANSAALVKEATSGGKGLKATVEALYYGNRYFLFIYKEYSDVRLVGAPPSSVGKFGGDTDNWMWPRHTGDFSIFRIYAGKDNEPAPYSPDNVPYRPKKFFKISLGGVEEGDFTFIYGFPGSTREYVMSDEVRYVSEVSDPMKIALRSLRLDIQDKYMSGSRDVRIRYSSKNASVANAWKKWQGEAGGIARLGTVAMKEAYEKRFARWSEGTRYEDVLPQLDSLYALLGPYMFAREYYMESANTVELCAFARNIAATVRKAQSDIGKAPEQEDSILAASGENALKTSRAFFRDYYLPIDKESFIAVMDSFDKDMDDKAKPQYFKDMTAQYGSIRNWADTLFATSVFTDSVKVKAIALHQAPLPSGDPALVFAEEFRLWYDSAIQPVCKRLGDEIALLYRSYMQGQMEFEPDKAFYPDANLTLRVAYGKVAGYSPADGIIYEASSTLEGIIEKDNPEIFDYDIPQRLRELHAAKDYGRWAVTDSNGNTTVPVCFLATNHTSGGNSGSPVINADGNLVGINFDRVWEGTMSDIAFDPDYCRNISLDIRYVLFIIDKLADAGHLLDEMVFVE